MAERQAPSDGTVSPLRRPLSGRLHHVPSRMTLFRATADSQGW